MNTPWGHADHVQDIGQGILFVSTPSHGGYWVPPSLLDRIPPEGQAHANLWSGSRHWYEEDCSWAYVALAFPDLFPPEDQANATQALRFIHQCAAEEAART